MKRLSTFWATVIFIASVAILAGVTLSRQNHDRRDARQGLAEIETPTLFADIPLPPDAKPHAEQSQKTIELRGRFAVVVERELVLPGTFETTDAFYQRELPARGWIELDHSTVDRKYCKAPYLLTVEKSATFEAEHRFALRLTYDDQKRGKWTCG